MKKVILNIAIISLCPFALKAGDVKPMSPNKEVHEYVTNNIVPIVTEKRKQFDAERGNKSQTTSQRHGPGRDSSCWRKGKFVTYCLRNTAGGVFLII